MKADRVAVAAGSLFAAVLYVSLLAIAVSLAVIALREAFLGGAW